MKLRKILVFFVCLSIFLITTVACTTARRPGQGTETVPRQTRRIVPRTPPRTPTPAPMVTPTRVDNRAYVNRARRIADNVAKLKEVESATCVISDNTAVVGVQFSKQYKGKMTNEIKNKIDKNVKATDVRIKRVAVTADPDLITRLQDIIKDIGAGKPISGFTKEVNELLNRIQPK